MLYEVITRYPAPEAWSTISNVLTAHSQVDDVAPVFWGVNTAVSGDNGDDVILSWDAARDHTHSLTTPIVYNSYNFV